MKMQFITKGLLSFTQYLDCMFERDPKSGGLYHERQVELYAKFEPSKLLAFLRSCNDIPLQRVHMVIIN